VEQHGDAAPPSQIGDTVVEILCRYVVHTFDIAAGAKSLVPGTRNDECGDGVVLRDICDGSEEIVAKGAIYGVAVVRTIDRQGRNAILG
jgi:hypothetical protein